MKYSILIFAGLKEKLNRDKIEIYLDLASTTPDIIKQQLIHLFPEAEEIISHSFVARNLVYARPESQIFPTDELALIPPVSGG